MNALKRIPRLIVNADDFGLSRSVNRGIIESHRSGIVTSTTILANGGAFEDALRYLSDNPKLGTGIHLNILRGRSVSDPRCLPNITREGLFFVKLPYLAVMLRKKVMREIEIEYRSQIEKMLKHNAKITHLDSEKHHHCFPSVFELVVRLASEYKIPAVRLGNEKICSNNLLKSFKLIPLCFFAKVNKNTLIKNNVKSAEYQIGIGMTGKMEMETLIAVLSMLPPGTTELCAHPGYYDALHEQETAELGSFYIDKTREKEIKILTDNKIMEIISRSNIELINYADV